MNEINVALVGPFIFALLEAVKRLGIPTKYLAAGSLLLALLVAIWISWQDFNALAILSNAGAIYLATEGIFKNGKALSK